MNNGFFPNTSKKYVHLRFPENSIMYIRPPKRMQSMPTVIKTKLPVHNFLLIGKNQSQHKAITTDKAPAKSNLAIPSYVFPFSCTHLPTAYPNVTFAMAGNVLNTPSGSKATPSP